MTSLSKIKISEQVLLAEIGSINAYFDSCKKRVEKIHPDSLSVISFFRLQRKNFKKDFFRSIVNTIYAPVFVVMKETAFWFEEMGWDILDE